MVNKDKVKILSTSNITLVSDQINQWKSQRSLKGNLYRPNGLKIIKYLGMVDVIIYRKIPNEKIYHKRKGGKVGTMGITSTTGTHHTVMSDHYHMNSMQIAESIETAIDDVNEIMRSKVAAINGNCIQGYKIEIVKLKEEYSNYDVNDGWIFLVLSAIGDALEV